MAFNFNSKYNEYVNLLPKYILTRIRNEIKQKYQDDVQNPYIDAIFSKHKARYLKKQQYDKTYHKKAQNTGNLKQQLLEKEQEVIYLKRLIEENKEKINKHIQKDIQKVKVLQSQLNQANLIISKRQRLF